MAEGEEAQGEPQEGAESQEPEGSAAEGQAPEQGTEGATEDPFPEPEALPEGQDTFDRAYVEKIREQAANYRVKAREAHETIEKYGEPEKIDKAVKLWDATQTEEGVTQLFVEAGQALGLGVEQLEKLFAEEGTEPSAGGSAPTGEEGSGSGEGDEEVPLEEQVKNAVREIIEEEVKKPQQEQQQQAQRQSAAKAVRDTLTELEIDPDDPKQATVRDQILALGQKHLKDGDFDPERVAAAVKAGHADFEKVVEEQAKKYQEGKRKTTEEQPGSVDGGSPPGGETVPEPGTVSEAKKRVRQSLGL